MGQMPVNSLGKAGTSKLILVQQTPAQLCHWQNIIWSGLNREGLGGHSGKTER